MSINGGLYQTPSSWSWEVESKDGRLQPKYFDTAVVPNPYHPADAELD